MIKRRISLLIILLALVLVLFACGDDKLRSSEVSDINKDITEELSSDDDLNLLYKEYEKTIHDDNDIKIILKEIKEVDYDKYYKDAIDVIFEIENKKDIDIVVQVETISVDGKMVNSNDITMSSDIHANKIADSELTISGEDENNLPKMEEDMEIEFNIFSWNHDDFRSKVRVDVKL